MSSTSGTQSFEEKLEQIKDEIIEEADGVTCEECAHAEFDCGDIGYCKEKTNISPIHGGQITISLWAPKCSKFCQKS